MMGVFLNCFPPYSPETEVSQSGAPWFRWLSGHWACLPPHVLNERNTYFKIYLVINWIELKLVYSARILVERSVNTMSKTENMENGKYRTLKIQRVSVFRTREALPHVPTAVAWLEEYQCSGLQRTMLGNEVQNPLPWIFVGSLELCRCLLCVVCTFRTELKPCELQWFVLILLNEVSKFDRHLGVIPTLLIIYFEYRFHLVWNNLL